MKSLKTLVLVLAINLVFSPELRANEEVTEFINKIAVKNYDCPSEEFIPKLDLYLDDPSIQVNQRYRLLTEKTHWLICMGRYTEALGMLESLVQEPDYDKRTYSFASAIYQIGFIYDVQEDLKRCDYYQQAESLTEDKYDDIFLSSQLSQISGCNLTDNNEGIKLGKMYELLERYSRKNDKGAIAHIHNNIGLLYGSLGQHVLAAEQYLKSYELGLDVYESSNLLASLISAITSQMASGDYEGAKQTISELKKQNSKVNTPLTNVWVHFSEAGYYYRTEDYESLRDSLSKWRVFLDQINHAFYEGLFRWYQSALCLHEENAACLRSFLEQESKASAGYLKSVNRNKDYLKLKVEIQMFLGNQEEALKVFRSYNNEVTRRSNVWQASGKVLGVANLHNQIINLETSLQEAENQKVWSISLLAGVFLFVSITIIYVLRRNYLSKISTDPLTGLNNTRTAINQIKKVSKPTDGKTNALALFDLDNFKEVNSQFGHITADLALQGVSSTLKKVTREQDILGRLASDQFLVCLTNIEESTAKTFFERISKALQNLILSAETGDKVNLRSSMSIYVSTDSFEDLDDVLADMQRAIQKDGQKN